MFRLLIRKAILILILVPLLNVLGFFYAQVHPGRVTYGGITRPDLIPPLSERLSWQAYADYVGALRQGDMGSIGIIPVADVVLGPLGNSLVLLGIALAIIVVIGPLIGFISVSPRSRRITPLALTLTTLGASMPGFFLGVAIIAAMLYVVLFNANVTQTPLPISGFGFGINLVLPVLVLASRPTLQVARLTAGYFEHELQQDYIRVARSKGLGWFRLFWQHVLPGIASPILVTVGQSMRLLLSGLIIVESLFQWPGVGAMFMMGVGIRTDGRAPVQYFGSPPLLAMLAVVFGAMLLFSDFFITLLATWLDPRLRQAADRSASGRTAGARVVSTGTGG